MKHPLAAVALAYAAGLLLGRWVEAPLTPAFLAALALVLAGLFLPHGHTLLLSAALLVTGWLNFTIATAAISPHDLRKLIAAPGELVAVRGCIATTPSERVFARGGRERSHTLAEIEVTGLRVRDGAWRPATGRVMTKTPGGFASDFRKGVLVEVSGIALAPQPAIAEGVFDHARYLRSRGIHFELTADLPNAWQRLSHRSRPALADRFRDWAQANLARGLGEQDEALRLEWAMLLGWQTALTAEVSEPFLKSGTMHIFAISGLHIALIAGICLAVFRALTVPRFIAGAVVIPLLWFYTAATGWQPSAVRSTVMMTVIVAGWMSSRPHSLLNSLAAAALIILAWDPAQLFQASFQLSFFVVLSLALLLPPLENWRERVFKRDPLLPDALRPRWHRWAFGAGNWLWQLAATSLAAFIGSMPLIAYYFHLFTPGSLLANIVVVPVSTLALMSGLASIVIGGFAPWLAEIFNHSAWFFMHAMIECSEMAAQLPGAWWHIRAPGPIVLTLYYGALVAGCAGWLRHRVLRWVTLSAASALTTAWLIGTVHERSSDRLTVLPLNGGHAVLLEPAHGGVEWLFNCGDESAVTFTTKPFLQARGLDSLPHLILTHGETDQIGGALKLHEAIPARSIHASPLPSRSTVHRRVLDELTGKSRVHRDATNGALAGPWQLLHPAATDRFTHGEDNGIVALGTFAGVNVLLVPNLGVAGQDAVFQRHPGLRADIIIAGLPARGEPLATEWLRALQPGLVVIADSEFPPSARARAETLTRLRGHTRVVTTREGGAITFWIRDAQWRLEAARPLNAPAPAHGTGGQGVQDGSTFETDAPGRGATNRVPSTFRARQR
jgi:competence protein ComEC